MEPAALRRVRHGHRRGHALARRRPDQRRSPALLQLRRRRGLRCARRAAPGLPRPRERRRRRQHQRRRPPGPGLAHRAHLGRHAARAHGRRLQGRRHLRRPQRRLPEPLLPRRQHRRLLDHRLRHLAQTTAYPREGLRHRLGQLRLPHLQQRRRRPPVHLRQAPRPRRHLLGRHGHQLGPRLRLRRRRPRPHHRRRRHPRRRLPGPPRPPPLPTETPRSGPPPRHAPPPGRPGETRRQFASSSQGVTSPRLSVNFACSPSYLCN
mmetsp:Transcript_8730/g.26839  ORF Transcript_8730/g.26839 Transcript_8730/m.26839 type:complete len:264 (+) Transcript_8730:490-1281(+)